MQKQMKIIALLLIIMPCCCIAQHQLPSYPAVLKEFFNRYSYTPVEAVDGLNFAKKKTGWYVQVVNRVTEKVKDEQLFWSVPDSSYHLLADFGSFAGKQEKENSVIEKLHGWLYNFFGYERCRYFGYSRWAEDMIHDFGNLHYPSLSDTLRKVLAELIHFMRQNFYGINSVEKKKTAIA